MSRANVVRAVLMAWALSLPLAIPAAEGTPAGAPAGEVSQIERKLDSIGTLIEKSSAARQIEASQVPAARAKHDSARALLDKARAALQSANHASASKLLDDAAREMFEAVRLAAPQQVTQGKTRADFDARLESVNVLLEAHKRISNEKAVAGSGDTTRKIEQQMAQARDLAAAGKLEQARAVLDRAYHDAKVSIGSMRTGDTLVHTLTFANKEEEYRYELDRNDTHQMLIKVLLDEKRSSASVDKMIDGFQAKAAELRRQAEAQATRKDFEGAIRLLEQSTSELVRAIRGAGVYIPG